MWVFEEMVDGKKLTEIINETHINVKYLPNKKIPKNVVSFTFIFIGFKWITLFKRCTIRLQGGAYM